MPRFLLVRHGAHDFLGRRLVGRRPGVLLNARGRAQSAALAGRLAGERIDALHVSPMERARETAEPIARQLGLAATIEPSLDEMDFGTWTDRSFAELEPDPVWQQFNRERALTRAPGGEMMIEVASRMAGLVDRLAAAHPDREAGLVLVGHGDPLRALIAHLIGLPLDFMLRFDLEPGSLSILRVDAGQTHLILLNDRSHCLSE